MNELPVLLQILQFIFGGLGRDEFRTILVYLKLK